MADVSECAFLIKSQEIKYPEVGATARGLRIDGEESFFDGISLVEFSENGKIQSLKEFQSKAEHVFPYGEI